MGGGDYFDVILMFRLSKVIEDFVFQTVHHKSPCEIPGRTRLVKLIKCLDDAFYHVLCSFWSAGQSE